MTMVKTRRRPKRESNSKRREAPSISSNMLLWLTLIMASISLYTIVGFQQRRETVNHVNVANSTNSLREISVNKKELHTVPKTEIHSSTMPAIDPKPVMPKKKTEYIKKNKGTIDLHFIHIPKCGGTSMTAVLRQVACEMDRERNMDCCINPGFCDWHAFRRCAAIKGCTDHFPNRPFIFKDMPSIAIVRQPVSRILSAWFYRGHTPNNDFFQVRPYFKDIRDGKLPKVVFEQYIEMNEYQNIQTRMLGADSFPYRNITINDKVFLQAAEALDRLFFVGMQEEYELSVQLVLNELGMHDRLNITVARERDQSDGRVALLKAAIRANKKVMNRVAILNAYDLSLYDLAKKKFCIVARKYPNIYSQIKKRGKVECV